MVGLALAAQARGDDSFAEWLKRDQAVRRDADRALTAGDFTITLPLGWIRDGDAAPAEPGNVALRHVGAHGAGTDGARVLLAVRSNAATDESPAAVPVWPSAFSGWAPMRFGALWALVARQPTTNGEAVAVQFPCSTATLTVEAVVPKTGAALPNEVDELFAAIRYGGAGVPLTPPGSGPSAARYLAAGPAARSAGRALSRSPALRTSAARAERQIAEGADPALGNRAAILDHGYDALLTRIHLIRNANRSICVQTFIWDNDETGRLLIHELVEAAKRGVKVRILADHFCSMRDVGLVAFVATVSPNIEMRHYRPAAGRLDPNLALEVIDFLIPNESNQRMHNKLLLVDDAAFVTGGRNVENTYYNRAGGLNYRDRDVLLVGPMATYAAASFEEYWNFEESVPSRKLKDVAKAIREKDFKVLAGVEDFRLGHFFDRLFEELADPAVFDRRVASRLRDVSHALYVADPPGKATRYYTAWRRGTMARRIEGLIGEAQREILLQTPYLVLDGGMLKLFHDVRARNPRLRTAISSNSYGSTDAMIAYAANFKLRQAYFGPAGLDVYEYMPQPKVMSDLFWNDPSRATADGADRSSGGGGGRRPTLCIHAKGLVIDRRTAFIGSYNFDPRSIQHNTECGLIVQDENLAVELAESMARDMDGASSWVIARRDAAVGDRLIREAGVEPTRGAGDLWAARHTSSFALKPGHEPAAPEDPVFRSRYDDAGLFPGEDQGSVLKKLYLQISTALTSLAIPLL
jgi:phosphatidylserine/phosphatidylglycerophosphate/cardiolipin synthase-like enzyme